MIKLEKLYAATRGGLDIILRYYPQAAEVVGTKNKFRARPGEKTASACLMETADKEGRTVWKVTDFGDDGHALSPIDIAMKEEGISVFYEAVLKLAQVFDVRDELDRSINKPEVRQRAATAEEKEGQRIFALLETIPAEHLKVLGPRVTADDAAALHWYEAEYVGFVKNREVTLKYSTENYPIFMRECVVSAATGDKPEVKFYKIYEPLNPDKAYRFSYTPQGVKPKSFINGLSELKALYIKWNAEQEAVWSKDPMNENKPYREEKLEAAYICSGERDALCCRSMGCFPIWFNSETYRLSEEEYREVMKYVKRLYNIPDIDTTGVKKGTELALRFLDIHTVWLPEWLKNFRDNRGKHRKDLRDWMELRQTRKDFNDLTAMAMPAKFWVERTNQRTGAKEYSIDASCLHHFLMLQGFYTLRDPNAAQAIYIKVEGNVVRRIRPRDIRKFIREWAMENYLPREVRNLILNSPKLADGALENLTETDLDFTTCTPQSQLFFFPRLSVEVTAAGLQLHQGGDGTLTHYVWEENVIPHAFKELPPMFEARSEKNAAGDDVWDIDLKDCTASPLFGYVINTSRIHWRREMEDRFADRSHDEQLAYAAANRFRIDGEGLTDEEVREQKQNLLAKLFAIGYMLHRHKSQSRAWAPQAMDNKIGEDGECNGRSGKSFLFKALSLFMKTVKLSGRNPKLMDNPHVFDQVTRHTDFVLVDDCARYLNMGLFYDIITSDMTVNPKNNQSYTIPFDESPKFGFTTNYVPSDFNASTEARMLYMVYSDYYHQRTEGSDYAETRSIRDDFGRELFTKDYPEEMWNADINFLLQCCRFYLALSAEGVKLQPPMSAIMQRKYKADMGENFEDWATLYFAEDGDNVNKRLIRRIVYDDYIKTLGGLGKNYTMNRFTKQLRAFANYADYIAELNPAHLCNSAGRITRRIDGKMEEQIYIETYAAAHNRTALDGGTTDFVPDEHETGEEIPF